MREYQVCANCVMDTSDPDISFDEKGVCSWCHSVRAKQVHYFAKHIYLKAILADLSRQRGKYSCILGLSGGLDSSYLAYIAHVLHLKPLVVVLKSPWDADEARGNIERIFAKLDYDIRYAELGDNFTDLQLAYVKSGVINLEIPQDHAIVATLWEAARELGIKYILTGHNQATESIHPSAWGFNPMDVENIKDIHRKFGDGRTEAAMPLLSSLRRAWLEWKHGIRVVSLLDYLEYSRKLAQDMLERELGWQDYGGKHRENVYTRWYQCYVMPTRWGIDKRRSHLSARILNGEMSRAEALEELKRPTYDRDVMVEDFDKVAKGLRVDVSYLKRLVEEKPRRKHADFKVEPEWKRKVEYLARRTRVL